MENGKEKRERDRRDALTFRILSLLFELIATPSLKWRIHTRMRARTAMVTKWPNKVTGLAIILKLPRLDAIEMPLQTKSIFNFTEKERVLNWIWRQGSYIYIYGINSVYWCLRSAFVYNKERDNQSQTAWGRHLPYTPYFLGLNCKFGL